MKNSSNKITLLSFLGILLIGSSCYEPQEGCLDVQATNFDVEADLDCCEENETCCCTYPSLTLSVDHKLEADSSANFTLGEPLTVESDSSHFFIIEDIKFYLTNLHFINSSTGEEVGVEDNITLDVFDDQGNLTTIDVEDNFSLIRRNSFDYTVGEFRAAGVFDQVKFDVGIGGLPNHTLTDDLNAAHALAIQEDSLQINPIEGYIFQKIDIKKDTVENTPSTRLEILALTPIQLTLNTPINISSGYNVSLNLRINHLEWYKGINFVVDNDEQIVNQIVINTTNVFKIVE